MRRTGDAGEREHDRGSGDQGSDDDDRLARRGEKDDEPDRVRMRRREARDLRDPAFHASATPP